MPIDEIAARIKAWLWRKSEKVFERNKEHREIVSLINSLKDKQRIPLILKYVKGFSYQEISEILGISEEAAK